LPWFCKTISVEAFGLAPARWPSNSFIDAVSNLFLPENQETIGQRFCHPCNGLKITVLIVCGLVANLSQCRDFDKLNM
jgi:hypothetical protein